MAIKHLTKEIEAIIISTLRCIFYTNTEFPYNDDDALTSIIITPPLPSIDVESKKPHVIITDIKYGFSQQFTGNNFVGSSITPKSKPRYEYSCIVPFSVLISCLSTNKHEAELLGDMLCEYFGFLYKETFISLGLLLEDVQAGYSSFKSPYPQFEFNCGVNLQGKLKYTWTVDSTGISSTLLEKVKTMISSYD